MGFFKSIFGGKTSEEKATEGKSERQLQKEFETLKYDGLRAQRLRRYPFARKCLEEAVKMQDDFEAYGYLAQLLVEMGDLQAAIEPLEHMAKAEPSITSTFISLTNVYFMLDKYQESAGNAQVAIDLEPNNPQPYFLKAKATNAMKQYSEAVDLLDKAITLRDDYAEALLLRGQIYLLQGQLTEALSDADAVIAADQEVDSALLLRGSVQEVAGKLEEAETDYRQVLELDPFNQQAFIALGKLFIQQGRFNDAVTMMDDAIEMSPVLAEAYMLRAEAKKQIGDAEGAAKDAMAAANLQAAGEVKIEVLDPAASIKEIDIMHL